MQKGGTPPAPAFHITIFSFHYQYTHPIMQKNKFRNCLQILPVLFLMAFVSASCIKDDLSGCPSPHVSGLTLQVKAFDADGGHAWQRDYKGHHALCFRQRQKLARHPPHLPFGTCHAGLSRTRRPETGGMGQRPARQPDTARTAAGRPLGDGLRVAHPPTPNSDNLPRSRLARRPLLRHHRYTDLRRCALRHRHPLRQGTSPAAQGLRRSRYGAPPQGVRGKLRRRFPLHPAQDGQHARLLRPAQRHRCELPPEASFNDRGDFVSSVFNILPTEEELRIDIYHRGVLQTTVISDSNGKPLRVSEGRLLNVLVDFDGAISVEVKVTDWGKQEIWKEF